MGPKKRGSRSSRSSRRSRARKSRGGHGNTQSQIGGFPPETLNVIDRHGGFTAVTMPRSWGSHLRDDWKRGIVLHKDGQRRTSINGQTLWRPGSLLKKTTIGRLVDSSPHGFYQTNNDVTVAIYKAPGYAHPIAVWFDNRTRERIA